MVHWIAVPSRSSCNFSSHRGQCLDSAESTGPAGRHSCRFGVGGGVNARATRTSSLCRPTDHPPSSSTRNGSFGSPASTDTRSRRRKLVCEPPSVGTAEFRTTTSRESASAGSGRRQPHCPRLATQSSSVASCDCCTSSREPVAHAGRVGPATQSKWHDDLTTSGRVDSRSSESAYATATSYDCSSSVAFDGSTESGRPRAIASARMRTQNAK